MLEQANAYATRLHAVDRGVRALFDHVSRSGFDGPEDADSFRGMLRALEELDVNMTGALSGAQVMHDQARSLEKLSKDLRPPLRTIRSALVIFREATQLVKGWLDLSQGAELQARMDEAEAE